MNDKEKKPSWLSRTWNTLTNLFHFIGDVWKKLWAHRSEWKKKHRLVFMDSETYKERWSVELSATNLFVWGGISIIILIALTSLIIAFTPLRELIPGYTSNKLVEQTYQNALVIDSLEKQIAGQERMLADIKDVIMGNDPGTRISAADSARAANDTTNKAKGTTAGYKHSDADSLLRKEVEEQDRYTVKVSTQANNNSQVADNTTINTTTILLFPPVKGKVISPYDPKTKHYGVDIAGAINEPIKAVAPGTVIFSNFTTETGHVIAIQHQGGMISIYKHNSALLKHGGDVVRAGEPIAFLGNSGELSSGPHLHFELWVGGKPVNPLVYISF
ncbi:MAG: M23 family metallopeptidase [Bacteroidales bacterium]|nr:M23 family metallopeptidase [Bacteroidales bacterium]